MPNKNSFLVEIDGITQLTASKVDGLEVIKHTPSKLPRGNRPNVEHSRGTYEVGEVTVTQAIDDGVVAAEVYEWLRSFVQGEDVAKRGARVIQLDESGASPVKSYECLNCVPTSYAHDNLDAGSNDPSYFMFKFQPEDVVPL